MWGVVVVWDSEVYQDLLEHSSLSLVEQTLSIFPSTTIHYEVSYYYLAPHSVQLSQPNHHAMHNI